MYKKKSMYNEKYFICYFNILSPEKLTMRKIQC